MLCTYEACLNQGISLAETDFTF